MKRILIAMIALLTINISASAMSYEQARQQALFLTDKMAYELNLTEEQYEAAYEVNLDYLMSVNTQADLYGVYWTQRNMDLSYILLDWQYEAYLAARYFYRPLYWEAGYWHFGIYARYPYRDFFYFGRPHFWTVYRGGHSWRMNGGRSWYHGRDFGHRRWPLWQRQSQWRQHRQSLRQWQRSQWRQQRRTSRQRRHHERQQQQPLRQWQRHHPHQSRQRAQQHQRPGHEDFPQQRQP